MADSAEDKSLEGLSEDLSAADVGFSASGVEFSASDEVVSMSWSGSCSDMISAVVGWILPSAIAVIVHGSQVVVVCRELLGGWQVGQGCPCIISLWQIGHFTMA